MCIAINSNNVKAARVKYDKTQAEMAEIIGINVNTYCQKEQGNKEFTLSEAKKVADFLGKSIDNLFFAD
ncbi:transcriptional regulator [Sporanaerobium hydrogeniformans]|uniref:Transcriptional regulator n=1 Tax=Sporanaerobium hydrogeniformans TaxID=3072179 RepID=A0AC61DFU1_9FIRM|nr:helix-turn-helix transcriptional regulator [Sporanaerobium hydrogeniformans]PHV72150.1 transcriptional regulator [Sporanaerobium hydrogeniformans]